MISRLPRWVWTGAWALAFIAGMINVVGLPGFDHQAISHLTGTTSLLGVALGRLDTAATFHFLAVLGSFVAGTAISGYIRRLCAAARPPLRDRSRPRIGVARLRRAAAQPP
jgi:uncharacterized membrane protein YoaK (UPF0700 family)